MSTKVGSVRKALIVAAGIALVSSAWAYDSSSYEQDGLIAQWDGIDNPGAGMGPDGATTQWIDLKHGYAFDLKSVTVGDSYMYFSGTSSSYACLDEVSAAAAFPGASNTVEICFKYDGTGTEQTVLKGPSGSNAAYGNHKDNGQWVMTHNRIKAWCFNTVNFAGTNTVALSYASDNASANLFYYNGQTRREVINKTSWFGQVGGTPNGNAWLGVNQAKGNAFKGKIYAVRVYNRVLTAEEVRKNCAIDQVRFCNHADWSVAEIPAQAYDGVNPCRPTLSVTDNETGDEMALGTDYSVDYEDNAVPGTGYAVLKPTAPHSTDPIRVPFPVRIADSVRRTCEWVNGETATAQSWTNSANWKDIDDDGVGDIPRPGDDVLVVAAAAISFKGAHVGTLRHTAGALTIDCGNGTFTNDCDFITTGASVTLKNTTFYLPYGEHVYSNKCDITLGTKAPVYFKGPGGFTKRGLGTLTYNSDPLDNYQFTGPLKICGGTFQTHGYGEASFFGPHEIIIDGATLSLRKYNQLNMMMTIRIQNRGQLSLASNTAGGYVHRLFINGQGCAIGKWGSNTSTDVDHKSLRITTGGSSGFWAYPLCQPKTDPYAPGKDLIWSGETKHWVGTVSTAWGTGSNWAEGIAPENLDDIVIPAGTPYAPAIPDNTSSWTFHTLTTEQNLTTSGWRLTLTGDLHLNGGNFTIFPLITFSSGTHVIDGSGTLTLNWHSSLSYVFGGAGDIIKRGTGTVTTGNTSAPFAHQGFLRVEGGSFKLKNSGDTMPNCTNVTVTGSGSTLQISAARFRADTVLSVADGGVVNLNGAFTNMIGRLYLDGHSKHRGRTYGSRTSAAERKSSYFSGKGALLPAGDDLWHGTALIVR